MKTNWREEFKQRFVHVYRRELPMLNAVPPDEIMAFIETLLEEVISEIPDNLEDVGSDGEGNGWGKNVTGTELKTQLRAKWLTKD